MDVCGGLDICSVRMKKTGCHVVLLEVAGAKSRGRSRKTWSECVKTDLRSLGMKKEWAQDRLEWRRLIGGNRPPVQARKQGC